MRTARITEPLFQSRNGLIWTRLQLKDDRRKLMFQSRNGLIWTQIDVVTETSRTIFVSIPQRSDLNVKEANAMNITRYKFQSRNGLIWTDYSIKNHLNSKGFQSRNGLIWTREGKRSGRCYRSFNPATVWFEHNIHRPSLSIFLCFNPATVWFERVGEDFFHGVLNRFQSRNGLIWTLHHTHPVRWSYVVSIPQRSDLNCVWSLSTYPSNTRFNPATVWFEQIIR